MEDLTKDISHFSLEIASKLGEVIEKCDSGYCFEMMKNWNK